MRIANISDVPEDRSDSPGGKFATIDQDLNQAIGGDWRSMDLTKRWPFAVEITRIPAGKPNYPFHSHSNQFEFYIIISGTGTVRHSEGSTAIKPGDFFMFSPREPHQLIAGPDGDLTYYSIADNPFSDHVYYHDSDKHLVKVPRRMVVKGNEVDYFTGEEEAPIGKK